VLIVNVVARLNKGCRIKIADLMARLQRRPARQCGRALARPLDQLVRDEVKLSDCTRIEPGLIKEHAAQKQ
jgi:hypothetical protein